MKKIILFSVLASLMLFGGCKKNEGSKGEISGEVVLTVGESVMTSNQFGFFLDNVKSQMEGTELSTEDSWETAEIEGKKAIDVAKERAYESAVQCLSAIEVGKKEGISCTQEQLDEMKSQIDVSLFEEYENAEEITNLICEANVYMMALEEKLMAEQPVEDKEIEEYFNENKEELSSYYMRAKHVLFLTQNEETKEPLPEAEIAEKKKQADDILARAKNGEDFDALVSEYSEDPGSHQNPDGYVFGPGEMVQEFESCVASLGFGEIGFAETSYGYHIIKRLDLEASNFTNQISSYLYYEKFDTYLDELMEEHKIEIQKNDEEYNKIK